MDLVLILENITYKIVVFVEFWKIIVAATVNTNKGYLPRV